MDTAQLFDAIRACQGDPRPIVLEVRTRDGLFKNVLLGVGFDENAIYLCAGEASLLPGSGSEERVRVQPLPSFQPPDSCLDCAAGTPFGMDGHHTKHG